MPQGDWQPQTVNSPVRAFPNSTAPCLVHTDVGMALMKTMDSAEAPGALVSEWIGHGLADLMGLRTFDYAIFNGNYAGLLDGNNLELTGPMFAVRWVDGEPWSGTAHELQQLENAEDVAKLVVLDTWLRNSDRKNPANHVENLGNVFIEKDGSTRYLVGMDFSHCLLVRVGLTSPATATAKLNDDKVFTVFDEFRPYIAKHHAEALSQMCGITKEDIHKVLYSLPTEFGTSPQHLTDLNQLILDRQQHLCQNLGEALSTIANQSPLGGLE